MNSSTSATQRLCVVTPGHSSINTGGSEFQIDCLLEVLAPQQRFEIYYLTSLVASDSANDSYRIVRIGDGAPRLGYVAHALPLYRALSNLRPSVIYQRVAGGYSGIAAHYARRHGAKFVWHIAHDSDVLPDASLEGRNPLRRYLEKRSVEYAIRRADCIIAQTEHQAQLLERNYGRKVDAIIPNFQPEPRETIDKSGPPTVLWIASLKPWKCPEAFVRLAAQLRELSGVRFVMVGSQSPGSGGRSWAESLASSIRSTSNLEYLGARPQAEVNRLLARAHVFVNTSSHEGFPNTFIQAWSRDVPIVSLHVDPDNLLRDRQLGVFCGGSEKSLADAVRGLLADPTLRAQFAARGRDHARERHSLANAHILADLLDCRDVAA